MSTTCPEKIKARHIVLALCAIESAIEECWKTEEQRYAFDPPASLPQGTRNQSYNLVKKPRLVLSGILPFSRLVIFRSATFSLWTVLLPATSCVRIFPVSAYSHSASLVRMLLRASSTSVPLGRMST